MSLFSMVSLLTLLFHLFSTAMAADTHLGRKDHAIRQACTATRFPDLCVSALSPAAPSVSPNPKASELLLASISQAAAGVNSARTTARTILDTSTNVNRSTAARNCLEILRLSGYRLQAASDLYAAGKIADMHAYTAAAQIYQYGCMSGLNKVNDTRQVVEAAAYLAGVVNMTSYATAMVAALRRYGSDMSRWGPPQTERDGYWPEATEGSAGVRKKFPPRSAPANATVCKGGGCGGYATVQAAVDAAPEKSSAPFVIHIKEGVYKETVRVPLEKTNLVFVGDGMGKTVITGNLTADMVGLSTYNTATVGVNGDGFMARDMTMANTAGPDAHQGVAFRSDSDRCVLESVEFIGHQDTLYALSLRQFYNACRIAGTVDFIFGNSAAVFRNCEILVLPRQLHPEQGDVNTVTAHGRTDPAHPTGFVLERCTVDGSKEYLALYRSNAAAHRTYLGRPWKEYSRTVLIQCALSEIVRPEGWLPWNGDLGLQTLFYGEIQSTGPGANATARVTWSKHISKKHMGIYTVENFLQADQW
ncbi:probable pectinesterase/pectinesterase inhibitor 51 [Zingiber officinale]|uniref:Pectinesterase n=1 Tax=Zingiber officinale TaxID=94328 RepID=A0A8J5LCP0_ZINOF|nr:probable pectinesterase/pectinesterase inhibitor 51 [Zingiber officinale]KAG6513499.1 hypothetical protein ZIOFF_023829 [Zingiber officinale]